MANTKEVRKQISSIKNTQKITSAMEMVAASKIRKTQDVMLLGRPYSEKIKEVISHIANSSSEYSHPFFEDRKVKKACFIVVSTDKGLCGGTVPRRRCHARRSPRGRDDARGVGTDRAARPRRRAPGHAAIERSLRNARAALRASETPPSDAS